MFDAVDVFPKQKDIYLFWYFDKFNFVRFRIESV